MILTQKKFPTAQLMYTEIYIVGKCVLIGFQPDIKEVTPLQLE